MVNLGARASTGMDGIDPQSRNIPSPASQELMSCSVAPCVSRSSASRFGGFQTTTPDQCWEIIQDAVYTRVYTLDSIFLNKKKKVISIQISLKFVPKDPIYRQSSLVQVMAWLQTDDKPLTEQMMSSLLIYFCVTRPPWVKGYLPAVGGGVVPLSTIRLGWRPLAATTVMSFNTLRPRQYGRHFADDTFKRIFMNENVRISINISLKCVPKCLINNITALVQIMAWRWPGNKPLSEPMMVSLPTHICVTRPQWVNPCCAEFILGNVKHTGLILGLCPVNERRHYSVTPSLIGWAQT